jgi:peptidoglycan/LPS O-acetylase OafA/YrhL
VVNNLLLSNAQQGIGDTLAANPFPTMWDGPLYTLSFEFSCYLLVAMLVAFRLLGGRAMIVLAALSWVWVQLGTYGALGAGFDTRQARLTLCFMIGSLIYLYRDDVLVRSRWWIPAAALLVAVGTYATLGFFQVGIVAFAYVCIWLGAVLPFHRVGVKRDYSYGMYIYGWPILQLAAFVGLNRLGLYVYLPVVLAVTVALAAASWHLVESHALRAKTARAPRWLAPIPPGPDSDEPRVTITSTDPG